MRLLCLCPTYGRRRSLLENTIACFDRQDYDFGSRCLVLFDDLGTLAKAEIYGLQDDWIWSNKSKAWCSQRQIFSTTIRCDSIAHKYKVMLSEIDKHFEYDAVVVWDDDDIYLPWHLSAHAALLKRYGWSKPSKIFSTYAMPPGQTRIEDARGRFHGSIAIRRDLLKRIGGWVQTTRADFDQQMLSRLAAEGPPGDPTSIAPPSYVYRWQDSGGGHCSGLMKSPDNQDWYARYQPDSREPIPELTPRFDHITKAIVDRLAAAVAS